MQHREKINYLLAYLVLAMFMMLVYQYVISISDPTKNAIQSGQQGVKIEQAFLVDGSAELTLSQLMSNKKSLIQRPLNEIPWGFSDQAYWIHLVIHNQNNRELDLVSHFSNPMLEQLNIYQIKDNVLVAEKALGWQEIKLSRMNRSIPSYEFQIKPQGTIELYARIATNGISKTPIDIYLKDDFSSLVRFTFLIWGSFVGILIVMALYNLVLFFGLKDRVYLVYTGYITSVLMMLGVVIGFGHYIWPESIIRFLRENIVAVNISVMIFTLTFALLFFNALDNQTKIVKFCCGYIAFLIIFAVISMFLPEYIAAPIFFVSMIFLYPAATLLIVQQFKINHKWARLYVASWIPLIIGGTLQPLGLTGVITETFIIHHALMIGVLFEIVLMAMALAKRMQFKKEQALFNAMHEPETKLANTHLLETKINTLLNRENGLAVCIIEITDFSSLLPYISNTDNNDLMLMVAKAIERKLYHEENFIVLEKNKSIITKLAKINEGVFAALINITATSDEEHERLKKQLSFLQHDIAKGAQVGKLFINLSTSVGVSLLDRQNKIIASDLIKQAYQALEKGKRESTALGVYQQEEAYNVAQRLALASDLQHALRTNELELYHQPQIDLKNNTLDGSEVLLRWHHKEYGFIAPDVFIKLAEDTGIINELTLWVADRACRDLEKILALGYSDYNVSVNISGKDIAELNFLDNIKQVISQYDISPPNLTFELTESVMVNDFHHLSHIMNELSSMGVHIAVDDYGTGYSSLLYISQLPFTEIKIDKSFVMNLVDSERNLTIVKATIEMAKNLNLKLVAEGIENEAVEHILKQHGCYIVQGYYYQKPQAFESYLAWMKQYHLNE